MIRLIGTLICAGLGIINLIAGEAVLAELWLSACVIISFSKS